MLIGVGGGALVLVGLLVMARARRRKESVARCLNCGRALSSPGAPCPHCGFAGEYQDEGA